MPAPAAAPATPATQADPKQTAANIVKGMQDKAAGRGSDGPHVAGAAPKDGAAAPPAAQPDPNAGKEKFVVNGKEVWLTPEQAKGYVQKGLAFEPRISELARLQQETAAFLDTLRNEPEKVLFDKRIGLTPEAALTRILQSSKVSDSIKEAVGHWYYENVVKLAKMDPKDREIAERDARIKEMESEQQARANALIAEENRAKAQAAFAQLRGQIGEAMKEIGLPNIDSPVGVQMAKRVADVMRLAYLQRKPITAKDAAGMVRKEITEYQRAFYDTLDEEKLVEQLGKENAEKVRKHLLKAVKEAERDQKDGGSKGPGQPVRRGERKIITPDEFKDYLDDIKRNNKVS